MDIGWLIFIFVVVFLIVFFVAWGLGVKPITAVALAAIWTLAVQMIVFPTSFASLDWPAAGCNWGILYWILVVGFSIYLLFYVTYMAAYDNDRHHKKHHSESMEEMLNEEMMREEF